jgi:ribosomal protein S12 methylthiotransferase accessory factor
MEDGTTSQQSSRGARIPYPLLSLRSRDEVLAELAQPCGRFKTPQTLEDKISTFITEQLQALDPLSRRSIFAGTGAPLNWMRLIGYLHEHGVIEQPYIQAGWPQHDRPKLHSFSFSLNKESTDGYAKFHNGFGASLSKEIALSKAIGESLERYFMGKYRESGFMSGTYADLSTRLAVLDIQDLNGFTDEQKRVFPEFDYSADSVLRWTEGRLYPSGKRVLMPAQTVFWNYIYRNEKTLLKNTTSGCAGHFTREEAVLSALLELIQRDAFLIYWLNNLSPSVLQIPTRTYTQLDELLAYVQRYDLEITFLDTTADIMVPTVTCVVIDRAAPEAPIISIGSSSGFDIEDALIQSALEAIAVNSYAATLETYKATDDYRPFSDKNLHRDARLSAWKGAAMMERFAFFLAGPSEHIRDFAARMPVQENVGDRLAYLLKQFDALGKGYEVYLYEAEDPLLEEIGFHVVRVVVPQLIPMYLTEYAAPLASRRLREVPAKMGYEAAETLNPWPHPFP